MYVEAETVWSATAATPLIRRSEASTPVTGSLKLTVSCVRLLRVLPASGDWEATVGAPGFNKLYWNLAPGAVPSKGLGGVSVSTISWIADQEIVTRPKAGWGKLNVYVVFVTVVRVAAATPLMRRS